MHTHRLLVWQDPATWFPQVRRVLAAERYRRVLKHLPQPYAINAITIALGDHFDAIRLFHGCRPEHINQYYKRGFVRHDGDVIERARRVLGARFGLDSEILERAISETNLTLDHDRLFFALDDRALLRYAGHYLIYGSESIMSIAASVIHLGGPNLQPRLRTIGRPTLFVCDMPWALLDDVSKREIAESLYDEYRTVRGRQKRESGLRDHTVVMWHDVPPSSIVSHHHPARIVDWHENGREYVYQLNS